VGKFVKGDPRARELGRKGGQVLAANLRKASGTVPYEGSILDMMDAAGLSGPSWWPWRVFLWAVFALPVDVGPGALDTFRRHTEREARPSAPVREAWMPVGRRGGKSRIAGVVALYLAVRFDASKLAPGEVAVIPVLAADRRQARQVLGYLKGLLELPEFAPYLHRALKETVELHNGVNIEVHTASFRTVRGYTCIGVVCDEVAFWLNDDRSANPDSEILAALRPAMATVPDALLLGLSSPYAARGELYKAVDRAFGKDDPHTLVWNADTASMNPELAESPDIARAFEEDPVAAASEYGQDGRVQFRRDVEAFLDPEAVRAVVVEGRRELAPEPGHRYVAFVDPSGGSQDSFTLAIAHKEADLGVLDCVREIRPPFSPDNVVQDFAALLRSYGISKVTGDRYAGEWPRERFRRHGIQYEPSSRTKSEIYREFVAPVNAATVALLDLPALRAQLVGLERRVSRGGRDSIDHAPGGRDDVANAAAGALVEVGPSARGRVCRAYSPGVAAAGAGYSIKPL
jgi:hypothetical protein